MAQKPQIKVWKGDITTLNVEAIVNAAKQSLLGGSGVDGAIHKAAGPGLLDACKNLNGCEPGQAKITEGYRLSARYVIHTVGPIWAGGDQGEAEILANCYRNSLRLALKHGLSTIAFPSISTGNFGYPIAQAAEIAVTEVKTILNQHPFLRAQHVCFSDEDLAIYQATVSRIWGLSSPEMDPAHSKV